MKQRLLLVGWDGADWHIARPLIAAGKMPQLAQMVQNGASGPIESLPPYLSPMLWNTIATGKHPAEHGIVGFTEYNPATGKIQPMSSHTRQVKALWNILSQEGLRTHVLGWFASHPAEAINGVCVAETFAKFPKTDSRKTDATVPPAPNGSVHPPEAAEALAELRVPPTAVDVNILQFFIPRIREIDLRRDSRPDQLLTRLSELYTLHNAAIATLRDDPSTDFLAIYYHFIDWVCHDFMEYGAPRRPEISERDFELYSGVVEKAYLLQDLLLRDLLQAAGPDTRCVVVSDHGFLSGDDRPERTPGMTAGIAAWHRPQGLVAMAGPGFAADVALDGASLFDVTPTILHAFDLCVGRDMRGSVLADAFADPSRTVGTVDSWETVGPPLEKFRAGKLEAKESAELLQQFADLGYIELKGDPFETAEMFTRRENAWNLGQALLNDRRPLDALPYLEEAWFQNPEQPHLAVPLARCQARLGLIDEARATSEILHDADAANPEVSLLLADLARECGDHTASLQYLEEALARGAAPERVILSKGLALLYLEAFAEAESLFREAFAARPDAPALLGLCRALTRQGKTGEAEPLVRNLLQRQPRNANGWFTLGQILAAASDQSGAKAAFAKALEIDPGFVNAQINLTKEERKLFEARGGQVFFEAPEFNFATGETRADRLRAEHAERFAAIREASRARFARWESERAAARAEAEPLAILRPAPKPADVIAEMEPIIIVTGLPRSGTSLMMQMLARGGCPIKTDKIRTADVHNERGYFEWEAIKTLREHPEIIDEAAGSAVKVVSAQLSELPRGRPYRLIWMDRPVAEVVRSQEAMILARHPERVLPPREERLAALEAHREKVLTAFREFAADPVSGLQLLEVSYHACLSDSAGVAAHVANFLQHETLAPANMAAAVDRSLHHVKET